MMPIFKCELNRNRTSFDGQCTLVGEYRSQMEYSVRILPKAVRSKPARGDLQCARDYNTKRPFKQSSFIGLPPAAEYSVANMTRPGMPNTERWQMLELRMEDNPVALASNTMFMCLLYSIRASLACFVCTVAHWATIHTLRYPTELHSAGASFHVDEYSMGTGTPKNPAAQHARETRWVEQLAGIRFGRIARFRFGRFRDHFFVFWRLFHGGCVVLLLLHVLGTYLSGRVSRGQR
ncbi:hypothetical protein CSPX01_10626 [Colletotrichum filicis]|nr:hypothetical protein CSPX01_10626 [Colletotrichum filicis]